MRSGKKVFLWVCAGGGLEALKNIGDWFLYCQGRQYEERVYGPKEECELSWDSERKSGQTGPLVL